MMTSIRVTTARYSFQVVREAEPTYLASATLGSPRKPSPSSAASSAARSPRCSSASSSAHATTSPASQRWHLRPARSRRKAASS
jgi:hypothetical protein